MVLYFLVVLCLDLLGVCGLQFSYAFYLDRMFDERKKHSLYLEKKCADLSGQLENAKRRIDEQEILIASMVDVPIEDENWADIIHDRY